jgi:hypothetical protein
MQTVVVGTHYALLRLCYLTVALSEVKHIYYTRFHTYDLFSNILELCEDEGWILFWLLWESIGFLKYFTWNCVFIGIFSMKYPQFSRHIPKIKNWSSYGGLKNIEFFQKFAANTI